MRIRITYGNGDVEHDVTDSETLADYMNTKFGSAAEAFLAGGGRIESAEEPSEPLEAPETADGPNPSTDVSATDQGSATDSAATSETGAAGSETPPEA